MDIQLVVFIYLFHVLGSTLGCFDCGSSFGHISAALHFTGSPALREQALQLYQPRLHAAIMSRQEKLPMPTPIPDEKIAALSELLFANRKIEAIKLYHEVSGLGLKEAKEAVEDIEAVLRKDSPDKFTAPQGKGCLGAAAAICICSATAIYWFAL